MYSENYIICLDVGLLGGLGAQHSSHYHQVNEMNEIYYNKLTCVNRDWSV
jgi:hypothetical protein